ncbi:hypothetical protein PASE110613_14225 [Paenibacillus sediminis]|uniref:Uncharacterized protein n=1 Tax=Paenibacillus sediminis TaxID=664909 RepID=A0ABS4H6F6_9BACL|nr:hypothetical protein [Paenibacillus sediminis]
MKIWIMVFMVTRMVMVMGMDMDFGQQQGQFSYYLFCS